MIQIQENCQNCLKCVNICRNKCLTMQNGKITYNGDNCMKCFHCYAICPVQAIKVQGLQNEFDTQFIRQLKERRSIRHFKQEKIDQNTLQQLEQIKQFAPSACNRRPIQTKVLCLLDHPEFEQKIAELINYQNEEKLFRTAPYLYFTYVTEDALKFNYPVEEDAIITTTQAGLYLNSINLGGFWCGMLKMIMPKNKDVCDYVKSVLNIPETCHIQQVYGFGIPDIKYERSIDREPVKVTFI